MSQDTKRKDNTQLRLSDEASDVLKDNQREGESRSACASRLVIEGSHEFICNKCWLRKDSSTTTKADF